MKTEVWNTKEYCGTLYSEWDKDKDMAIFVGNVRDDRGDLMYQLLPEFQVTVFRGRYLSEKICGVADAVREYESLTCPRILAQARQLAGSKALGWMTVAKTDLPNSDPFWVPCNCDRCGKSCDGRDRETGEDMWSCCDEDKLTEEAVTMANANLCPRWVMFKPEDYPEDYDPLEVGQ